MLLGLAVFLVQGPVPADGRAFLFGMKESDSSTRIPCAGEKEVGVMSPSYPTLFAAQRCPGWRNPVGVSSIQLAVMPLIAREN